MKKNEILDVEVIDDKADILNKNLAVQNALSNISVSELHIKTHKSGKKSLNIADNNTALETNEYNSGAKSLKVLQVPKYENMTERNNMIKELRKEKHSVKEIALATGLSTSRIRQITKKNHNKSQEKNEATQR